MDAKDIAAKDIAASITLRDEQLKDTINSLMGRQDDIQEDILELQRRKRQGEEFDEQLLLDLKAIRKESSNQISLLAMTRTELLDDLPVIRLATGKIKIITAELNDDAELIKRTAEKIENTAKMISKAENVLLKIIKITGVLP